MCKVIKSQLLMVTILSSQNWIAIMLGKSQSGEKIKSLSMSKCFRTMVPQLALPPLRWLIVSLVGVLPAYLSIK